MLRYFDSDTVFHVLTLKFSFRLADNVDLFMFGTFQAVMRSRASRMTAALLWPAGGALLQPDMLSSYTNLKRASGSTVSNKIKIQQIQLEHSVRNPNVGLRVQCAVEMIISLSPPLDLNLYRRKKKESQGFYSEGRSSLFPVGTCLRADVTARWSA